MTTRLLAGIPCTAESPSSYRIQVPYERAGAAIEASWITFTGEYWTLVWLRRGELVFCSLRFPSPVAVAEYLIAISADAVVA